MKPGSTRIGSARRIAVAVIGLSVVAGVLLVTTFLDSDRSVVVVQDATSAGVIASSQDGAISEERDAVPAHRSHSVKRPEIAARTPALDAFLVKFDEIQARGFVKTMRSGSTGIGYTLETLLDLKENNDRRGDFMGMEIKAYRDSETELNDSEKMNLFLKEPKWLDGLRSADRIREYGYVDDNGRTALYSTVTVTENSHGLRFEVDDANSQLFLLYDSRRIGVWTFEILQKRLLEKHTEAVFVAAESRGRGRDEEFRYHTVRWCSQPSVDALVKLIRKRDAMLELRMHVKENGSARNHGSAFRVHKNKLKELYATVVRCR